MNNPNDDTRRTFLGRTAAASLVLSTANCGYLLYPERRGRTSGRIDVGVLIIDLVWLIPGLVPGIICLVVDFTTGCIYGPSEIVEGDTETKTIVAEVDVDDDVVAKGRVEGARAALEWNQSMEKEQVRERGRLVFRREDGATAEAFIRDLI